MRLNRDRAVGTRANANAQLGSETPPPEDGISCERLNQTGCRRNSSRYRGDCPANFADGARGMFAGMHRRSWRCVMVKKPSKRWKPQKTKACPHERHQRCRLQYEAAIQAVERREPAVQRNHAVHFTSFVELGIEETVDP